jgi:hypothetical protein
MRFHPRNIARAACAVLVATFASLSPDARAACGMPLDLPQSPTTDDDLFSYYESLGDVRIAKDLNFKIPLGFSPVPGSRFSHILGAGWTFPIVESAIYSVRANEYELLFPSGHYQVLRKTKTAGQLAGGIWLAEIKGNVITVKSRCGWTLVFSTGRLKWIRSPEGALLEFQRDTRGNYRILANRTPEDRKRKFSQKFEGRDQYDSDQAISRSDLSGAAASRELQIP